MPTQHDFRQAAALFRSGLDHVVAARHDLVLARDTDTIEGGTIAPVTDAAVLVGLGNVDTVGRRIDDLAGLCDRRAAVCAVHEADLDRWRRRISQWEVELRRYREAFDDPTRFVPWPGNAPSRPVAPAPWVEPR